LASITISCARAQFTNLKGPDPIGVSS
jgi:hypothetical protein